MSYLVFRIPNNLIYDTLDNAHCLFITFYPNKSLLRTRQTVIFFACESDCCDVTPSNSTIRMLKRQNYEEKNYPLARAL